MNLKSMFKIYMDLGENKITHMGRYSYSIQFDTMMGKNRIIRCLRGRENGQAVQYDFCGNAIESTIGNNWEWREVVPEAVYEMAKDYQAKKQIYDVRIIDDVIYYDDDWMENDGHWEGPIKFNPEISDRKLAELLFNKGYLNTKDMRRLYIHDEGDIICVDLRRDNYPLMYLSPKY